MKENTVKQRDLLKLVNLLSDSLLNKERETNSTSRVASDGSRSNLFQQGREATELLSSISMEYHLTVRTHMDLSRRQASLLLDILNYQSVYFGINFGMYLAMEYLSNVLLGNKLDPLEIGDTNERKTVMVSLILLSSIGGKDLNLVIHNLVPQPISQRLIENGLLLNRRVYGSRLQVYRPENILEIRAVPVSTQFDRVKGNSERYSSYCKGYGESHPSARKSRTSPSPELDGEPEKQRLISLADLPVFLVLTQLEVRARCHREKSKS